MFNVDCQRTVPLLPNQGAPPCTNINHIHSLKGRSRSIELCYSGIFRNIEMMFYNTTSVKNMHPHLAFHNFHTTN